VLAAALGLIRTAVENAVEQSLQPLGTEQPVLDMRDHHGVELVHRNRPALAAGITLPCPDRTGIIAIATILAGAHLFYRS
jgi:hypothetical protein